jgi:hypothetical protein
MENVKERAKQIFDKMILDWGCNECHNHWAKECSLILVDEILKGQYISIKLHEIEYWKKVKKEINKL